MRTFKRGFTLLELMIAITLMMIIMLMLQSMFINAQALYVTASRRATIYQQARVTMDVMEQDLLRMRRSEEIPISMRSLQPEDWGNSEHGKNGNHLTVMDDWVKTDDDASPSIREFLSFPGTNTWYDSEVEKWRTGDAVVVYYLRKRAPSEDTGYEGAYLVRRLIPIRSLAEIARMGKAALGQGSGSSVREIHAHEDEICGFVYGVRVFVDDQAAVMHNRTVAKHTRVYDIMPEARKDSKNKWLWVTTQAQPPLASKGPVNGIRQILPFPPEEDRAEFGGNWTGQTSKDRDFVSSRWNYPSTVMIEMTINDKFMLREEGGREGEGTYRSFSRAVQLPVSGPMNNLDITDKTVMAPN